MKITPRQIAHSLYQATEQEKDTSKLTAGFWRFLQKRKLTNKLPQILLALKSISYEKSQKLEIKVESARQISPDLLDQIKNQLQIKYPQKNIRLKQIINRRLIGGIRITTPQTQLDLSIQQKLLKLKQQI